MILPTESKFQLGKNGLTSGVITSINNSLKTHKRVRINVLKSCCRNKEELKDIAEKIKSSVNKKANYKIIGYTIILIKQ